jgi:hypothetical protein
MNSKEQKEGVMVPSPNSKRVRVARTPGSASDTCTTDDVVPPFCKEIITDDATTADVKSLRDFVCLIRKAPDSQDPIEPSCFAFP